MTNLPHPPLVETDWLAARLDRPGLRIIDARWRGDGTSSRDLYRAGHIPGAVPLDWQFDLACTDENGLRYRLLPPDQFALTMRRAGINNNSLVVAYADYDYSGATRLWWALRYYGHTQVAVLNGGFNKWLAEGRPVTTNAPEVILSEGFECQPRAEWRASAAEIKQALDAKNPSVRLVDTRPPEQYVGRAVWTPPGSLYLPPAEPSLIDIGARGMMRAGHIPGALNLTSSANLDPQDWTFLPVEQLRERARSAGLTPTQRVITYCGVGISASLGLFALHLAGFERAALYDASWEEWGTDPSLPIE